MIHTCRGSLFHTFPLVSLVSYLLSPVSCLLSLSTVGRVRYLYRQSVTACDIRAMEASQQTNAVEEVSDLQISVLMSSSTGLSRAGLSGCGCVPTVVLESNVDG